MAPKPITRPKIVKKKAGKFIRFQSDRFMRVPSSWRKVHGIDCAMRRRFRGTAPLVSVGYGSNKKTRHTLPGGFRKMTVHNEREMEALLMHNGTFAAELAHNLSIPKRKTLLARAEQLNIKVLNPDGRMRKEETK